MSSELTLCIGDVVRVLIATQVGYDGYDNRTIFADPCKTKRVAVICGAVRRRLGKYRKGSARNSLEYPGYVEDEPRLEVTGTVLLYELRRAGSMTSKPFYAQPKHVKRIPGG